MHQLLIYSTVIIALRHPTTRSCLKCGVHMHAILTCTNCNVLLDCLNHIALIHNTWLFCEMTNYNDIAFISTTPAAAVTTTIIIAHPLIPNKEEKTKKKQQLCNVHIYSTDTHMTFVQCASLVLEHTLLQSEWREFSTLSTPIANHYNVCPCSTK